MPKTYKEKCICCGRTFERDIEKKDKKPICPGCKGNV